MSNKGSINYFAKKKKNRINFEPTVWGKKAWPFLYSIAFGYPMNPTREEMEEARNFFISLKVLLACMKCRKNYKNNLKEYPLDYNVLENRVNLIKWLYEIENQIKIEQNKKTYTLDETINYYYNMLNIKNSSSCYLNYIIVIIVFGIFLTVLYYLFKKF